MTREELKTIPVAASVSAVPRYLKFPTDHSPLLLFWEHCPRLTGVLFFQRKIVHILLLALLKAELILDSGIENYG